MSWTGLAVLLSGGLIINHQMSKVIQEGTVVLTSLHITISITDHFYSL